VAWPFVPPAVTVVEAITVILSPTPTDLYALLQYDEDFEYGRKTRGGYIEVFWRCWWRTMSHHHRLAGTSNLLVHDDVRAMKAIGSIGSVVKRSISPGWRGRRQRKISMIEKNLSSDYHVE
jgi:hypothetical protein